MGNREKARVEGCVLESEDSGSRRRETIARMHHNEIAIAIEKKPTRDAGEKGIGGREWEKERRKKKIGRRRASKEREEKNVGEGGGREVWRANRARIIFG